MASIDAQPAHRSTRPAWLGWGTAVVLVVLAWGAAFALRGGGEKAVLDGWVDGLDAGQAKAEQMDRPMVVLFTASWCPPCQVLKKQVLTQPVVHDQLLADFVPVQIDLSDRSTDNPSLDVAERYGVRGIPAVLAINPEGDVVASYNGGPEAESFAAWMASIDR